MVWFHDACAAIVAGRRQEEKNDTRWVYRDCTRIMYLCRNRCVASLLASHDVHELDGKHKLNVTIIGHNEYVPAIASATSFRESLL
jgi:hypothetical protein